MLLFPSPYSSILYFRNQWVIGRGVGDGLEEKKALAQKTSDDMSFNKIDSALWGTFMIQSKSPEL